MIAEITYQGRSFRVDLSKPIDISQALQDPSTLPPDAPCTRAWWVEPVRMTPVSMKGTTYLVKEGAPVNFRNITFNPHGHATHTECVGHITSQLHPVGQVFKRHFHTAQLVSILPEQRRAPDGRTDLVITFEQLRNTLNERPPEALVVRTLPHEPGKVGRDWSGTGPPYLQSTACSWLRSIGVKHLLLDLPSVDREEDGGVLAAHHAFWDYPASLDLERTITELIVVPQDVRDGEYLLELQLANFMNDAAPSRPVLYAILP